MGNMHNIFRIARHFQPKRLSVSPVSYFWFTWFSNQMNYSRQHVSVVRPSSVVVVRRQKWWHVRAVIDGFERYMAHITHMGNLYGPFRVTCVTFQTHFSKCKSRNFLFVIFLTN